MKIVFQGKETESAETTLGALVRSKGMDPLFSVVEIDGEIYANGTGDAVPLKDGASVNIYNIVSGG